MSRSIGEGDPSGGSRAPPLALLAAARPATIRPRRRRRRSRSLTVVGAARYVVQPDKHRVQVSVDLHGTSRRPETLTSRYVYDRVNVGCPAGHDRVPGDSIGGARTGVSIGWPARPGRRCWRSGSPSDSPAATRLDLRLSSTCPTGVAGLAPGPGRASLVAFPVWAFGSKGIPGASVSVRFPAGFRGHGREPALATAVTAADGTTTGSSGSLGDPFALSAYVLARSARAFEATPLDVRGSAAPPPMLPCGRWQDDADVGQRRRPRSSARHCRLSTTIGLTVDGLVGDDRRSRRPSTRSSGWLRRRVRPVAGTIRGRVHGGAGVDLHEAAHAWFDGAVFADRWMVEGSARTTPRSAAAERSRSRPAASRAAGRSPTVARSR